MKRKLLILSVLAICVAIVAAGTLAYFTAEDTAHNVITTGGVDIELKEGADEAKQTPATPRHARRLSCRSFQRRHHLGRDSGNRADS